MRITRATPDDLDTLVAFRDEAAAWLASQGIDQWQEPWPTERPHGRGHATQHRGRGDLHRLGRRRTPAATITINRWAKPELWTEEEAAEPALYAHKVTVDRAYAGQGFGAELLDWAGTRAADEGADWLRVDVWTTNEHLQHYYLTPGLHLRPHRRAPPQPVRSAVPAASRARPNATPARGQEPDRLSLGRAASSSRGGSLVLPPRPGWRDLAGRCWHARPPAASAPPTNPAPEPSPARQS